MQFIDNNRLRDAIRGMYPDAKNIRKPDVCGTVNPVFIADVSNKSVVCKFSDIDMAMRNMVISQLLNAHAIPVPNICVHHFNGIYFESYDYCTDKTLFELTRHISPRSNFNAFKQIMDIQYKFSLINPAELSSEYHRDYHRVVYDDLAKTKNKFMATIYAKITRELCRRGMRGLYHNDLHPKNVLLDSQKNVSRILDLDAVATGNETYALALIMRNFPGPDSEFQQLLSYYENLALHRVDRKKIAQTIRVLNMGRRVTNVLSR